MEVPDRGSLVWLLFSPQAGREQAGRRPRIVLTSRAYHLLSDLAIVCPITNRERGWPTEVKLPVGLPISGVVLVDQIRSIDRDARKLEILGQAPESVLDDINARLAPLLHL
jgi:mRNA interferase MazF